VPCLVLAAAIVFSIGVIVSDAQQALRATFLHLRGVGHKREQALWQAGIRSWESLETYLASGGSLFAFGSRRKATEQLVLLSREIADRNSSLALAELATSRQALDSDDLRFFLARLPAADHWRVLSGRTDSALFLDIETTGLSIQHCYVTVIGALYQREFYQWVWGDTLDVLVELLAAAPLVVTFNGARFDLPFLAEHLPKLPTPRAHVDLVYIARAAGFQGGQKIVEEQVGLKRGRRISGLTGAEAVVQWCEALYGNSAAYHRLLDYNRADVLALPELSVRLLRHHVSQLPWISPNSALVRRALRRHQSTSHQQVRARWLERRVTIDEVVQRIQTRRETVPRVVGIDLRGKRANPTGWAVCEGPVTSTRVMYEDEEILAATIEMKPALVSIDAPLSVPRHYDTARERATIVRDAERILWSRGIPVYPAMINQMVALTRRGIELAKKLEEFGIPTIESYPGAAQDLLGIPRKGASVATLLSGLRDFGYSIESGVTHDELDAITSALVGQLFLSDQFEAIGAADEGYMLLPGLERRLRWDHSDGRPRERRAICITGVPGSGKSSVTRGLAAHLQVPALHLGESLREHARSDVSLRSALAAGALAPEDVVKNIVDDYVQSSTASELLLDGFPRHPEQFRYVTSRVADWTVISLEIDIRIARSRLLERGAQSSGRPEDQGAGIEERLRQAVVLHRRLLRELPAERLISVSAELPLPIALKEIIVRLRSTVL
jgi:uncharacterized protein YprB with RNaseH-like and TPR domain/predicted nuclease with RNAse H fold/adenylate kinase family enzyme